MSSAKLQGGASGTGSVTLLAPNTNSTQVLTLPDATDTVAALAATQTFTNKTYTNPTFSGTASGTVLVSGTAVASTSGTSIDFTSIPSWVKRITVMFSAVSTNGSSPVQIQLGTSSGATTSGYLGSGTSVSSSVAAATSTAGFKLNGGTTGASEVINGLVTISLLNNATNTWSAFGGVGRSDAGQIYYCAGSVPLAAVLDRVRITTVNGTDTFDAGSINILYE